VAHLSLHIDLASAARIGPGKIRLLELVDQTGSISAAGRAYRMTYKQAWTTLDELNRSFRVPVVTAAPGGRGGGGARLTEFGHEVVRRYRELEQGANSLAARYLETLESSASPAAAARD
jgi:molybdate transport system regulatory protein